MVKPRLVRDLPDAPAALVWELSAPHAVVSSAPVGGGRSEAMWLLNIQVARDYARTDLAAHAAEVASAAGLAGAGPVFFTAADVARYGRGSSDGAFVDATVGIRKPTWAADPSGGHADYEPGTINIVVQTPWALSEAAAVNVVATVTEAKTQVLFEAGVPGTGTASDAVAVVWPLGAPAQLFGGPRSVAGASCAIAAHAAVAAGVEASS